MNQFDLNGLETLDDWNALLVKANMGVMPSVAAPVLAYESITVLICGHTLPTHDDLPVGAQDVRYRDKIDVYENDTTYTGYSDDRDGTRTTSITLDSTTKSCVSDAVLHYDETVIEDDDSPGETITSIWGFQVGTGTTNTRYNAIDYSDPSKTDEPLVTEAVTWSGEDTSFVPSMSPDNTWDFTSPTTYEKTVVNGDTTRVFTVSYNTLVVADFTGLTFDDDGDTEPKQYAYNNGWSANKVQIEFRVNTSHLGTYFKLTYDIIKVLDSGTTVETVDDFIEWTGPGSGTQDDASWLIGVIEILPPDEVGHKKLVNLRFEFHRGQFGSLPQVTGETY